MALLSQKIKNLLNGVSQQPPELRSSSQAAVQENALSSPSKGLRKRPPTHHIAKLSNYDPSYRDATVQLINRSTTEQYVLVIMDGDLKVFDAGTGVELPVSFPQGKDYLGFGEFRTVTVGDYTFLVNRRKAVALTSTAQPTRAPEAFVTVREADYSTAYELTLDSNTVAIQTVDFDAAGDRAAIGTDQVANDLAVALLANSTINTNFSVSRLGSTIYLKRKNNADFTISGADGLGNKGLSIAKAKVQTVADLPPKAVAGAMLEIEGDPGSLQDNFWTIFEPNGGADWFNGVWRECPAPGTQTTLDATTMPWALVRDAAVAPVRGEAEGQPPLPVLDYEGPHTTGGFTQKNGVAIAPGTVQTLSAGGDTLTTTTLPGGPVRTVTYTVDARKLSLGATATVELWVDPGGDGLSLVDSKTYQPGTLTVDDTLSTPLGDTGEVWLKLTYTGSPTGLASVTTKGTPIASVTPVAALLTFQPFDMYPEGTTVTADFGFGFDGSVTVSGSDAFGDDVARDLATAINTNGGGSFASVPTPGVLRVAIWPTSPTFTCGFSTATTFYNSALRMPVDAHVGATLKNLTTNATGTITSNSTRALKVGSMTGGTRSTILPGDVCTVLGTGETFTLQTLPWKTRGAGSTTTCPAPSFVGKPLSSIFFYQNRLGFTAGENIVLSAAGDLFNFWRQTATQLLADDTIDIKSAHQDVATFDHVFLWRDELYLGSGAGHQFLLSGDPVLTPTTVRLDHITSYPMSRTCRPLVLGNRVFFARHLSGSTRVTEYLVRPQEEKPVGEEITLHVPSYLAGVPVTVCGDASQEFLGVVTDGALDTLWVYNYHYEGAERQQASWSQWTFPGATVLWADMAEGRLLLLMLRADGVYLEKIELGTLPAASADHRDRQGSESPVEYTFRYQFSPIYLRDTRTEVAETAGRLTLRYGWLSYHDTCGFTVTVSTTGRTSTSMIYASAPTITAGRWRFPILGQNTTVTIEIAHSGPTGCAFSGLDWEATYTARAQRQ